MEAILDVDGTAYCSIAIQDARVPPSSNFVDSIYIQDGGFGTPNPVLQLILNDSTGTLDQDLNIQDGTLITIKLAKEREKVKVRNFRVFNFTKQQVASGPQMVVTCIFDAPTWLAGVYTESVRGSSDAVMADLAGKAGLEYDGAGGTDDVMTWLNVNRTRSSFSEDVAIRGRASPQSCMARTVTLDNKLKYKDLYKVITESPKWSYLQNSESGSSAGTPITVRETQNASTSGLATHIMNYGQTQYQHSLNESGQHVVSGVDAPVFGASLPINEDVRGAIAGRGAQINYTGWDPGTEPKPASNIHEFYEESKYQNLRYLGLLSERVRLLTDDYTEVEVFDCASYRQSDAVSGEFQEKKALAGNWIVGGKTIWIRAGHKYCEVHFLYRPTIMEAGNTETAGGEKDAQGSANAVANENESMLPTDTQDVPSIQEQLDTPIETEVVKKPGAVAAKDTLTDLKNYGNQTPLNNPPITGDVVNGDLLATENSLRNNVKSMQQAGGPVAEMAKPGPLTGIKLAYGTVKKFASETVEMLAGRPISMQEALQMAQDPKKFKATAMDRVTNVASDVTGVKMHNIVSAATGGTIDHGAIIGDVVGGGLWADDLKAAGITPEGVTVPLPVELPLLDNKFTQQGAKFLYDMTGLGYNGSELLIDPRKTADAIDMWSRETNPERILMEQGFKAYDSTFGDMTPKEAEGVMAELGVLARDVGVLYAKNELIFDRGLSDSEIRSAGRDVAFIFGDPSIAPLVDSVEEVVRYNDVTDVQTKQSTTSWADYYSMGAKVGEGYDTWKFPYKFPAEGTTKVSEHTNGHTNEQTTPFPKV